MADKKNIKVIYDMCANIVRNEEKKSQADKEYQHKRGYLEEDNVVFFVSVTV